MLLDSTLSRSMGNRASFEPPFQVTFAPRGGITSGLMSLPHYHCPDGCENPQPFLAVRPGRKRAQRYCGRCFFKFGQWLRVARCTPETCS